MFNLTEEEHNWVAWYKRRNPRNRATHLRNTKISAKCVTYFCQSGNHVYARSVHCG